jgi:hypothetical protein
MVERRSRGEGSLSWNERRQRWIGRVSVGFSPEGKRRVVTVSAPTKTEAKLKLRDLLREQDDGTLVDRRNYTVGQAVQDWLENGLSMRDPKTIANRESLARTHLLPTLGKRRLVDLTVRDVDVWLANETHPLEYRNSAQAAWNPPRSSASCSSAGLGQAQRRALGRPS